MPTQTPPLNESLAYTWCPQCRAQGNDRSPLIREMHVIKCNFGHSFSGAQLQQFGADMVKATEVFLEQPTITDVAWKVFINPRVRDKLEQKYVGRLMITVSTLLAALADDTLVMITGEQAKELRELGIRNGSDMISAIKAAKETERGYKEALGQIDKFQAVLHAAGVPGA